MFYENLAWFTVLWVSLLVVRRLWRAAHPPVPASVSLPKRLTPRPPQTPHSQRLSRVWSHPVRFRKLSMVFRLASDAG